MVQDGAFYRSVDYHPLDLDFGKSTEKIPRSRE